MSNNHAVAWRWRRLQAVLQRLRSSLSQRGWRGTLRRIVQEFRPTPSHALPIALLPLDWVFEPFILPTVAEPEISVIIPVHGQLPYTLACLRSIAAHAAAASFEVIVVDDASPDVGATTLERVEGLRLLTLPRNLGFVGACNAGAGMARGRYLLFLNNDTQVTPGWLDALHACFDDVPDCGIAGARLLYPDGRLQECGALVFADGSAWNCGRFEDPSDPRYLYRRECDYVSGAALMIPAALFRGIGGFDARYAPAYYEDTDLAFAVREAGRRILVQPASTVVHCEGVTAGTDPGRGVKRHQAMNQTRFAAKWGEALRAQPEPGSSVEQARRRAERRGPALLVIESTLPDATRDSGSVRLIEMLRLAGGLGWSVTLLPDDGRPDLVLTARLGAAGVAVVTPRAPRDWLREHARDYAAVLLSRYAVASVWLPLVRALVPGIRVIFDTVDLHYLREARAAAVSGESGKRVVATRQRELDLIAASDCTLLTSSVELDLVRRELPAARLELLGNIHRVHEPRRRFAERRDLLFIGGFQHPPNADAVRWFAEAVLPLLRERLPGVVLHVIGTADAQARRTLAGNGIVMHGRVDDIDPWLDGCRVSIAPLRFGAGVKGKINTAMSCGLPVVATTVAAEAMGLSDEDDVLLADTPEAFADAVVRAYIDEALWLRLSRGGLDNVRRHFSPEQARAALRPVLGDARDGAFAPVP